MYTDKKKVSKYELSEGDTLLGISYSVVPKAYIVEHLFACRNTTITVTGNCYHLYKAIINARIMLVEKAVSNLDESEYFKRQFYKSFDFTNSVHEPEIEINDL